MELQIHELVSELLTQLVNINKKPWKAKEGAQVNLEDLVKELVDEEFGYSDNDTDYDDGCLDSGSDFKYLEHEKRKPRADKLINSIISHRDMLPYHLSNRDVLIIANLWRTYLKKKHYGLDVNELMLPVYSDYVSIINNKDYLVSLMDRKILKFVRDENTDYHYNIYAIMDNNFNYDYSFLSTLIGNNPLVSIYKSLLRGLKKEDSTVKCYMKFLGSVFNSYPELTSSIPDYKGYWYGDVLKPYYSCLYRTFESLPDSSPVKQLQAKYSLTDVEIVMLLIIHFYNNVLGDNIGLVKIVNLFAVNEEDFDELTDFVKYRSHLIQSCFIDLNVSNSFFCNKIELNQDVQNILNSEYDPILSDKTTDLLEIIQSDKRFNILETNQTIEQLILPKETKDIFVSLVKKLSNPAEHDLAKWGLMTSSLDNTKESLNSTLILLHGQPGTGKTFAAGAIANSLNKTLIGINATLLKNHYYGDSQKLVKEFFGKMRNIISKSTNIPVFLLNEADQIIHMRQDLTLSCSSTENAIQNIFLEELETFPGILIATTNLLQNFDSAMSRRFNYKIELPLPDEDCRRQLWKLHLPESIPGSEQIDIDYLAKKYLFSGGQIRLVVMNACSAAIIREEKSRFLTSLDLIKYSDLELDSGFEERRKAVGFGNNN